jgi:hypothetical protein
VDSTIEKVFPTRLCKLEINVFTFLLSIGISYKSATLSVFAAFAFEVDDSRAIE